VEAIPLLAEEAAKRQKEGRARGGRTAGRGRRKNNSSPQKVGGSNHEGEAVAQAAKIAHTNRQYVADAAKLMKEDPEEFQRVKAGEITLPDVRRRMKEARKAAVVVKIRNEPRALPTGPFRVIVIDPPWRYEARAEDVTHRARSPYPDMSLEEIQALPVAELAHDDCILWLWTTNAFVFETPALLRAWGFEYKTKLTWFKDRIGTGNWLRGQTEDCLLAVRGKPVVTLTNQSTSLAAPAGEHSRKPDKFYAMVESLCPGNKLEMFARQPREGWQSWGAELADGDALEQKGA
jgi:N6-adenosine-specific RNA methylase IME4